MPARAGLPDRRSRPAIERLPRGRSGLGPITLLAFVIVLSVPVLGWIAASQRRGRFAALARAHRAEQQNETMRLQLEDLQAAAQDRDRAEAASEAKSRFLATVSHEIRTPLSGVLGLAGLLAETTLTREQQSYVAAIKTSGQALIALIEEMLDFARIEAGRLELEPQPFDITELVEGVVELLAPRAQGKGLEIASFVSADVPARLIGDANRLRQVLLNLAGNAVKFTEQGGVGVAIGRQKDGRILFSVSDTGPGVPYGRRETIFEEFEQGDNSTTRRHGGAGLGLAITTRIVTLMGGELGFRSRTAGGSLFAFSAPLPPDPALAAAPLRPAEAAISRVLVVSAELFQPSYLAGMLGDYAIQTVQVATFSEAAAVIRESGSSFDGLFVDCGRGADEARAVSAMGRLAGIRKCVLLFSPFQRRAFGEHLTAGFDAWLVKPVRRASLAERLFETPPPRAVLVVAEPGRRLPPGAARVLLAEDNPINALIARNILERAGAEVTHAEDGEAAVAAVRAALADRRPFDLVLMDVCMPSLDGFEAARQIRAAERSHAAAASTIVATTAQALRQTESDCVAAGMDAVLIKPVDPADLQRLVSSRGARIAEVS
jgi:signal transduction histidine kinase/CheY-like chemotaxis protein